MPAEFAIIEVDVKLLCPVNEEGSQAIDTLVGETIVPAIDKAEGLGTPAPIGAWMHRGIHGVLHAVKVAYLTGERLVVHSADLRTQRAKQAGDIGAQRRPCTPQ